MPKTVTIHANPDFENKRDEEYKLIKIGGPKKLSFVTALENVRLSEGRYQIAPEKKDKAARINTDLQDMDDHDLKVMLLSLGIKTTKKMKRSEVITSIRTKLADVEIVDDEAEE